MEHISACIKVFGVVCYRIVNCIRNIPPLDTVLYFENMTGASLRKSTSYCSPSDIFHETVYTISLPRCLQYLAGAVATVTPLSNSQFASPPKTQPYKEAYNLCLLN
jgi:hypothetical protein